MSKKNYENPYTYEDLQRLELAIAEGVREVQYNDKKVVYRSMNDMLKAVEYIQVKLGLKKNKGSNSGMFGGRRLTMRPTKGLEKSRASGQHGESRFDRNED